MIIFLWIFKFICCSGLLIWLGENLSCLVLGSPANTPSSFILGLMAYTFLAFPLSAIGIPIHLWLLISLALLSFLAASFLPKKQNALKNPRSKLAWFEIIGLSLMAVLLTIHWLLSAAVPQFDIDLLAHILMKSKILFYSTYKDSSFFHDTLFANVHANYPPGTVFLYHLLFLGGLPSLAFSLAFNHLCLFLIGFAIYLFIRQHIPISQSLLWTFIFISTNQFLASQFIISSTDILLALGITVSVIQFLRILEEKNDANGILFSLLLSSTLFIKNEAILFVILMCILTLIFYKRYIICHFLIMTLILGPWLIYRMSLPDPTTGGEAVFRNLQWPLLFLHFQTAIQVARNILVNSWNSLFLGLIPAGLILRQRKDAVVLVIIGLGLMLGYFFTMLSYIGQIDSYPQTFVRLLTHAYPLVIICCALAGTKLTRNNLRDFRN